MDIFSVFMLMGGLAFFPLWYECYVFRLGTAGGR